MTDERRVPTVPVDWDAAGTLAARIVRPGPRGDRAELTELVASLRAAGEDAAGHIAEITALEPADGLGVTQVPLAQVLVVDRASWARANAEIFSHLVPGPLRAERPSPAGYAGATQVAGVLALLSGKVLGQFDPFSNPGPRGRLLLVAPNILAVEREMEADSADFRLWVALHEVTHRTQFTGVPWLRHYFLGLVEELMGAVEPDPKRLFTAAGRIAEAVRTGRNPLDEGGVVALFATQAQRDAMERVGGLMSLLEGHGDVTMDRAAADQVPSAARFARVLRTRRKEANLAAKLLQRLIGLEAKLAQYEQGERFIEVVEGVGGPALLNRVFERPEHLPTLTEIREPQRWLDRIERSAA